MVGEILQHLELAIPKGLDFCVRLGQLLGFASITHNQHFTDGNFTYSAGKHLVKCPSMTDSIT